MSVSVLAWRIPGTGEPVGLPFMGSHRVRHDWHDLAAAWVKIREIERLNQSKWLKPVRALGFQKKGLTFARDSSLTPKWDVNSGCSNKEELWLRGSQKGQRRRRFSGNELISEREPVQEKTDATVSHWFLTSRGQAEWIFDSILSKKSLFPRQGIQISFVAFPVVKRVVFTEPCSGRYHVSPVRWRAPQGQELDSAYHFSPALAHCLAQSEYSTIAVHVNL